MTDIDKQVKEIELCASAHCDDGNVATGLVLGKAADTIAAQSKRIQKLEKQVEALKGLDEWEPIENGKTGHLVLAAAPDGWDGEPFHSVGFHALVYWCDDENDWCDDITDKPYGHAKHLTHFIDLDKIPTPPKDMGGAK